MVNNDITRLFYQWKRGDDTAKDELSTTIYQELHRLATFYMNQENLGHTLQPTAIVNEVYIQLNVQDIDINDHEHLFALVSTMMRNYLVNYAKSKLTSKRGGSWMKIELLNDVRSQEVGMKELIDFDAALTALEALDQRKAQIIELRYFGGQDLSDIAQRFDISDSTLHREIKMAKIWLMERLSNG